MQPSTASLPNTAASCSFFITPLAREKNCPRGDPTAGRQSGLHVVSLDGVDQHVVINAWVKYRYRRTWQRQLAQSINAQAIACQIFGTPPARNDTHVVTRFNQVRPKYRAKRAGTDNRKAHSTRLFQDKSNLQTLDGLQYEVQLYPMTALYSLPPGPRAHPLVPVVALFFPPPWTSSRTGARYGETFTFRLGGFGNLVQLTRPQDIREVFRGDPAVLHAGEGNALLGTLVGDTSVLVLDDAAHVRQRRILMPPLKGERMRNFFDAMQSEALATATAWAGSGEVRADVAMQGITLRVILRAVLGVDSGADFAELEASMGRLLTEVRHPLVLVLYNLFPPHKSGIRGSCRSIASSGVLTRACTRS